MTCGILYNFAVLNSPVTGHLGKMTRYPIGKTNSDETYGVRSWTCEVTSVRNFRHRGALISDISQIQ